MIFENYIPIKSKEEILIELEPKNVNIEVDIFENIILQDISMGDNLIQMKLSRNLTQEFNVWLEKKLKAKEQIKMNIKGETRSGKSLIGIRVCYLIWKFYKNLGNEKPYTAEKVICANQKILRQKLNTADFGDFFQIDENAFANVGTGSMTEMQQLKDINNIIAKQNIHMVYITPQTFLPTGATTGLAYFGKDTENWVSRFLLYSLKSNMPSLLGYVVFDVGNNFKETGCYIYKQIGGCTNPRRKTFDEIDKDYIYYSDCIDKSKINEENIINNGKSCPFYNVCNSFMCGYEHMKDEWIAKEMVGGISEREQEKLEVALMIFKEMAYFKVDTGEFRLNASNGKELKLKIKMRLPFIINTKYTGVEIEEIITIVISLLKTDFMEDTCKLLNIEKDEIYNFIINKENPVSNSNQNLDQDDDLEIEKPKKKVKKIKKEVELITKEELNNLELSEKDNEIISREVHNREIIIVDNLKYLENKNEVEDLKLKDKERQKRYALEDLENDKKNRKTEMGDALAVNYLGLTNPELIDEVTGRNEVKEKLNLTDNEIVEIVKKDPKNYFNLLEHIKENDKKDEKNENSKI